MDLNAAVERIVRAKTEVDARAAFQQARGYSGLSQAVFAKVLSAFGSDPLEARRLASYWRMMLAYGDDPALAYRTRGAAERIAGKWLRSAESFLRAGEVAGTDVESLSFAAGAVDGLARAGRVPDALELAQRLSKGLEELGERGLAARVQLNAGNALLWQDRYREAEEWLEKALPWLTGAEAVYCRIGLSTAKLFAVGPISAHRDAEAARTEARALGLDYAAALAGLNLAQASLLEGRSDEALDALLEARPSLENSPPDAARLSEFLGDAYLQLNLWTEASDAYAQAIAARDVLPALNVAAASLGLGQTRFAMGDDEGAAEALRQAYRRFRMAGNAAWTAAADTCLAKLLAHRGRLESARKRATEAAESARNCASRWHEAEARLTAAEISVRMGLQPEIRRARLLVERNGFESLRWRPHAVLARASGTLKSHRRAFEAILECRALTTSTASRLAYLRDKQEPLSAYLATLLERPTPARVREAISVVERSRSAALLDEILASGAMALLPEQVEQVEAIRRELQSLESSDALDPRQRRSHGSATLPAALMRKWTEATRGPLSGRFERVHGGGATILAETGGDIYALREVNAVKLPISTRDLHVMLRWLRFEVLAPMVDRSTSPDAALDLIAELRESVFAPWEERMGSPVSPEGLLWQVPWTAFASRTQPDREVVIALHPRLAGVPDRRLAPDARVMLWIDRNSDLPFACKEAEAFLRQFPAARVCGSLDEVRAEMSGEVDLLHVICHANHNPENGMFSSLQFGDGSLYAGVITRSPIRPALVTLSACDTGQVSIGARTEPDGLVRAFLARGASAVVGSLWPLDDEAACVAYTTMFEALGGGATLPEALNCGRKAVRQWNQHPYFWAPLALFGGYRE